ncbi:type IX secretion system motor protein PorM/GldM [Perlabentimonas gracilis]|uniref:type IX secretion system motor protein PorM/GldM n=1 Tax=Perlabentimonas gracilis TaxID=2715279 RepID=UPI00140D19DC|nr:gliding motility protein GldM [Perlabentimonas gracilis]NHB69035.1 gliding motility protein GldM [Perlabentimonas gracilis]
MAGGKETPRQKMIGMMYLVLTAMLALNVSATVLDAFVLVDSGLSQTTKSFTIKNERLYNQMESAYAVNPTKVEPWKLSTDEIREKTKEMIDYLQDLKVLTVVTAEKEDSPALLEDNQVDAGKISGKSDTNTSGRIFLGSEGGGKATDLKKKIAEYREFMKGLVDETAAEQLILSINNILNTDDPPPSPDGTPHTWESTRFDHIPLVAIFPQLTKIQLDILNVEAEVVGYLLQQVDAGDFKVNKLDAVVIPKSSYIFQGNEFQAEIFLAASDTTQVPRIFIGNYESYTNEQGVEEYRMVGSYEEIPIVGGRGIFNQRSNRIGINRWSGLLEVTAPDGSKLRRPFNHEFEVAQPNVVVSPSKMNVFYRGVENPVEISIPGISMDRLSVNVDGGGTIRKIRDGFEVIPGRGNVCNVTVFAEIEGQRRNMGTRQFRVRDVPDPTAAVRNITARIVDKNELAASLAVEARMPMGFDFDLSFNITSFTVMATVGGFTRTAISNSQLINDEQRRIFESLRSGQTVNIIDVKAVGPDGRVRELNDIVYRIR